MASQENPGFIAEYHTDVDGWRQCASGRHWKTEAGAEAFRRKWAKLVKDDAGWEPPTRVTALVRDGHAWVAAA